MGRISKLHEYTLDKINSKFPFLKPRENYYPDWLVSPNGTRLELDIFIDDLRIAAEIQGEQHSKYIPFFHGNRENFKKQVLYDEHKAYLCRVNNIKLYDISTEKDADIMVYEISEVLQEKENNKPKYFYQMSEKELSESEIINRMKSSKRDKISKLIRKNEDEEVAKRLERAKTNLEKYNKGELQASQEKVDFWISIIERNGIMDIEKEFALSIDVALKRAKGIKVD